MDERRHRQLALLNSTHVVSIASRPAAQARQCSLMRSTVGEQGQTLKALDRCCGPMARPHDQGSALLAVRATTCCA
ncbi:hypothetical protein XFF6990_190036 [Xanthomonas citri pv. fuscans]|nr:hypothetical protein XFF6990_190036 [Xanthomonas citri pv. fuscans]